MPVNTFIAQVNVIEDLTHYAHRPTCPKFRDSLSPNLSS